MPKISEFYGISIYMYYRDHPPPHFHAMYGDHEALVSIQSGEIIKGDVPNRVSTLVREWADLRRSELAEDWDLARRMEALKSIAPLP